MKCRPYDVAMSYDERTLVEERRRTPTGRLLRITTLNGRATYPWSQMRTGDFFFVPLLGRRADSISVRLRQVAARKDWELTLEQMLDGDVPSLRVALTLDRVSEYKAKAQRHHGAAGITYSDGKWSETRRARYKKKPRLRVTPIPTHAAPPPVPISNTETSVCTSMADVSEDVTLSPTYNREQVIRERLAALGIKA